VVVPALSSGAAGQGGTFLVASGSSGSISAGGAGGREEALTPLFLSALAVMVAGPVGRGLHWPGT
jgi:hypothetical protein